MSCSYPEEYDFTDAACPAWWRGNDAGGAEVIKHITDMLNTGMKPIGVHQKPLQDLIDRVFNVMELAYET